MILNSFILNTDEKVKLSDSQMKLSLKRDKKINIFTRNADTNKLFCENKFEEIISNCLDLTKFQILFSILISHSPLVI